jgi:hypothetical protein
MARIALPGFRAGMAFGAKFLPGLRAVIPLLLASCAFAQSSNFDPSNTTRSGLALPTITQPISEAKLAESEVWTATQDSAASDAQSTPGLGIENTKFALPDAINYALQNNPRLRSARAVIQRSLGQADRRRNRFG